MGVPSTCRCLSVCVCVPCVCVCLLLWLLAPCPCVCVQQRRPYWPCLGCFFVCLPVAATHAYVLPADFPSDCNCFEELLVTHREGAQFIVVACTSHTDRKIERERTSAIPSSSLCLAARVISTCYQTVLRANDICKRQLCLALWATLDCLVYNYPLPCVGIALQRWH